MEVGEDLVNVYTALAYEPGRVRLSEYDLMSLLGGVHSNSLSTRSGNTFSPVFLFPLKA